MKYTFIFLLFTICEINSFFFLNKKDNNALNLKNKSSGLDERYLNETDAQKIEMQNEIIRLKKILHYYNLMTTLQSKLSLYDKLIIVKNNQIFNDLYPHDTNIMGYDIYSGNLFKDWDVDF
jgi:hypothetical protein